MPDFTVSPQIKAFYVLLVLPLVGTGFTFVFLVTTAWNALHTVHAHILF